MAGAIYSAAQESFAREFAKVRRSAGLTQTELANRICKHQSYVSDIERGQRRVDVLELFVLAHAMEMSPLDLYAQVTADIPEDFKL